MRFQHRWPVLCSSHLLPGEQEWPPTPDLWAATVLLQVATPQLQPTVPKLGRQSEEVRPWCVGECRGVKWRVHFQTEILDGETPWLTKMKAESFWILCSAIKKAAGLNYKEPQTGSYFHRHWMKNLLIVWWVGQVNNDLNWTHQIAWKNLYCLKSQKALTEL